MYRNSLTQKGFEPPTYCLGVDFGGEFGPTPAGPKITPPPLLRKQLYITLFHAFQRGLPIPLSHSLSLSVSHNFKTMFRLTRMSI